MIIIKFGSIYRIEIKLLKLLITNKVHRKHIQLFTFFNLLKDILLGSLRIALIQYAIVIDMIVW